MEAKSLSNLPPELYQPIFEQLRIQDLFNVMEADEGLARTAILALRNNIPRVKLNRDHGFYFEHSPNLTQESAGHIDIQNYNFAITFLSMFSDLVRSLDIDFLSMQTYQMNGINAVVAAKCAQHLKHFGIALIQPDPYSPLIPAIFPRVESVSLTGNIWPY